MERHAKDNRGRVWGGFDVRVPFTCFSLSLCCVFFRLYKPYAYYLLTSLLLLSIYVFVLLLTSGEGVSPPQRGSQDDGGLGAAPLHRSGR